MDDFSVSGQWYFFAAELDRPHTLVAFIDEHRARFGGVGRILV